MAQAYSTGIKIGTILILATLLAVLFGPDNRAARNAAGQQLLADQVRRLNDQQRLPEHFSINQDFSDRYELPRPGDFSAMEYFRVLRHLSMEPGYTLDYFYWSSSRNGRPMLYARKQEVFAVKPRGGEFGDDPDTSDRATVDSLRGDMLNHIRADGTRQSFFELATFVLTAGQFYLAWHCNYNDDRIVCNREGVHEVLLSLIRQDWGATSSASFRAEAMRLDVAPRLILTDSTCTASVTVFSRWLGFTQASFVFRRNFPHRIDTVMWEPLLKYDCRIRF